jgi:hypothetical protein
MMGESKTVRVKRDTWLGLHELKEPGETMDEVISGLLPDDVGEQEAN